MRAPLLTLCLAACGPKVAVLPGPLSAPDERAAMRAAPRPSAPPGERHTAAARPTKGDPDVVHAARRLLTGPTPSGYRADCSGFVQAVVARAGGDLAGSTATMWAELRAAGRTHTRAIPSPGDLAFFDNTYDRDGDGRANDELTHIAVVLSVDADGTITLAHDGTSKGRTTLRMNLRHPADRTLDGAPINDALRGARRGDPPGLRYLASELWRGFGTPVTAAR